QTPPDVVAPTDRLALRPVTGQPCSATAPMSAPSATYCTRDRTVTVRWLPSSPAAAAAPAVPPGAAPMRGPLLHRLLPPALAAPDAAPAGARPESVVADESSRRLHAGLLTGCYVAWYSDYAVVSEIRRAVSGYASGAVEKGGGYGR